MKKSYHSMVVPTVAAITALRNCALCSASGSPLESVLVVDMFTPEPSLFYRQVVTLPGLTDSEESATGASTFDWVAALQAKLGNRKAWVDTRTIVNSLRRANFLIVSARG